MTGANPHNPTLETERLLLRTPDARDLTEMLRFFTSQRAQFYGGPLSTGEGWNRFAVYAGQWALRGYGFFAITARDTGETLGLAGPHHPYDFDAPEMSWLLTEDRREGHGYAFEACQAVLRHLFATQPWTSVVSFIDPANAASRALALKLGAERDTGTPAPAALPGCDTFRHRRAA
ncbi:MAG: GNAT family N-acetyltransferase [Pseudomonadota bacterium]